MEIVNLVIAVIGMLTGGTALIWNIINDIRKVRPVLLGNRILLLNFSRRPVNIDSVGLIFSDKHAAEIGGDEFKPIITIPSEDQRDIDIPTSLLNDKIKYVYARDVLGKEYRERVRTEELRIWLDMVKTKM